MEEVRRALPHTPSAPPGPWAVGTASCQILLAATITPYWLKPGPWTSRASFSED